MIGRPGSRCSNIRAGHRERFGVLASYSLLAKELLSRCVETTSAPRRNWPRFRAITKLPMVCRM